MQVMQKPFFKFTEVDNDGGTVWYTIQVHAKGDDPEPIIIKERYSQLREIHEKCMETQYRNELPDFPQKKLFGSTKDDFIQKRKKELEYYYNSLSKTIDIEKLSQLNKFIESHRKKKTEPTKTKTREDDTQKLEAKSKKETQLRGVFENIFKEVVNQIVDLSSDFYPVGQMSHDDSSKKFSTEMSNAKPPESALLAEVKVEGLEQNETEYMPVFLRDNFEQFIKKSQSILGECSMIEKSIIGQHRESIVVVK